MTNILVTMPFGETLLAKIRVVSPHFTVAQGNPDSADYSQSEILYAFMPPADLARAPNLKWVQLHLAGVNMLYDHPIYATNTPLTTTSGVHAASVAEYVFTVLLALAHRVPRMLEWQAKGRWPPDEQRTASGRRRRPGWWQARGAWPPDEQRWPLFVPAEVRGATLGIIGYGSIGREVARIGKALAMRVLASKRDLSRLSDDGYRLPGTGDPDGSLPDAWFETSRGQAAPRREHGGAEDLGTSAGTLRDLLAQSDYVVLCAPLTRETEGLVGEGELRTMKPSAYFFNVGRGATVDEPALVRALAEKRIAGAALDVFTREPLPADSPLYQLDNVILSPHVSGFIPSYDEKCTDLFVANLKRYLNHEPLLNLVDRQKGY